MINENNIYKRMMMFMLKQKSMCGRYKTLTLRYHRIPVEKKDQYHNTIKWIKQTPHKFYITQAFAWAKDKTRRWAEMEIVYEVICNILYDMKKNNQI